MTDCSLSMTIDRIKIATPTSRIAVFRSARRGMVDCFFADTKEGMRAIKTQDGLIGIYHKGHDIDLVYKQIHNNMGANQ